MILDNADDARVLRRCSSSHEQSNSSIITGLLADRRLDWIPRYDHGKVLVTSRSIETAKELVYRNKIIVVNPMEEEQALALLQEKLEYLHTEECAPQLAQALGFMPLALTQAAAYISESDGRCSVQGYLEKLEQYDRSGASILDVEEKDLRRDPDASNSIMLTW